MTRWFRFYDAVLDDPKVQRLADHLFRGWVNILCLASKHGGTLPSIPDIAFCLRIPDDQADSLIQSLLDVGLLEDNGEFLTPHNWAERQYVDTTNAQRQQRFRDKKRAANEVVTKSNAVTSVTITPLDTDTDTEQIQTPSACASDFEIFWEGYPKKMARGGAEKAWASVISGGTPVAEILAGLKQYKFATERQFIPSPARWLYDRRWLDESPAVEVQKPKERDLRNVPDTLLNNDEYWRKRRQMQEERR